MSVDYIINANIHRIKEGARVLEDVARFTLRDKMLFQQIRALRHDLLSSPPIKASQPDLGGPSFEEDNVRANLLNLVQANALRIQEGLRVLEEVNQQMADKQKIKLLRYQAYALQQSIYQATLTFLKQEKLKGLYLVVDTGVIHLPLPKIAKIINQSKVNLVQFRHKHLSKQAFFDAAFLFRQLLSSEKLLIINDHLDIALDIANGVHLGQQDYPLQRVRALVPDDFLFGVTCHTLQEAKAAEKVGASYVSVGCLFPSRSKHDTIPCSLTALKKIRQAASIPICAIGGINARNLVSVIDCHVAMVALISAVWTVQNPLAMIEQVNDLFIRSWVPAGHRV